MTEQEARAVVFALIAAFPQATIEQESADLYTAQFSRLKSAKAAGRALERIVNKHKSFPSIAEFGEVYRSCAELERPAFELVPALSDDARARLADASWRFAQGLSIPEDQPTLTQVGSGECDDCSTEGDRVLFESLRLCRSCAGSRLRVRAQVNAA